MKYEVQIVAKDQEKIILFRKQGQEEIERTPYEFDELCYVMGAAIDGKAQTIQAQGKMLAKIEAHDMSFDELLDVMCEDLDEEMVEILTNPNKVSVVELSELAD